MCKNCINYYEGNPFICSDCGIDTNKNNEYYMVQDKIWKESKVPKKALLCIACLEKRLGRMLKKADFSDAPINWLPFIPRSARLKTRLLMEG
jgi:hypothetical protein